MSGGRDDASLFDRLTSRNGETVTTRRRTLQSGAGLLAALSAGGVGVWQGGHRRGGALSGLPVHSEGGLQSRWAFDPDALRAEPMGTHVETVDETPVLFQYGRPVPTFDTWAGNSESRDHRSLDGEWRFRFDGDDRGVSEGWYGPGFDDSGWEEVPVPLPWDLYDTPGFGTYDGSDYGTGTAFRNGVAWYRTEFTADESWDDRLVRLNFLGASYMAWVFLNGTLVGQHEGGNTPFALDVSDVVRPGETNTLAVRVFRRPSWRDTASLRLPVVDASEVPGRPVDYWPYAGLTRSVYLEATPRVTVSKLLADARDGTLSVRAVVENRTEEAVSRVLTVAPGEGTGGTPQSVRVELGAGEVRVPRMYIDIPAAASWTPQTPACYRLTATLSGDDDGDELSTRYGMRTLATEGARLTLNGAPLFLKGVNWHEETPTRGRSLAPADYDEVFDHLDELNANFLRNSHYNRHPYLYEAADEAGVVVMDEADNMWLDGRQQRTQLDAYGLSRALVAAMVWNQHNHPSVGLWSLHNECEDGTAAYREWVADMRAAATALDRQDRAVTWAARSPSDPAFDLADVAGFNEYYGYFTGEDADLGRRLDDLHAAYPETPLLVTENGTWSAPELRDESDTSPERPGTPAWQAAKFDAHWAQVTDDDRPFVAGYTYWALRDYKERNGYNESAYNGISTMGLLPLGGDDGTLAYEAFRDAEIPTRE